MTLGGPFIPKATVEENIKNCYKFLPSYYHY